MYLLGWAAVAATVCGPPLACLALVLAGLPFWIAAPAAFGAGVALSGPALHFWQRHGGPRT